MVKSSSKILKRGCLAEIIRKVKRTNNLPESVVIHESMIRKRLTGGTEFLNGVGGHTSPLLDIEPSFVSIILHMARIHHSLTPAQALNLINGMINMAPVQHKLATFKGMPTKKRNDWKLTCVGRIDSNRHMKRRRKRHWSMEGMEEMREMNRMERMMFKEQRMRTKRSTHSSTFTR